MKAAVVHAYDRPLSIVYIFTGAHELAGRRSLALDWCHGLRAPSKHLYSYAGAGHATLFEHAGDVRRILERRTP